MQPVQSIFPEWYAPFCRSVAAGKDYRQIQGHHAMLVSYFDDSSDKRREHYFACGGLIGHESQWFTFDLKWIDATHGLKKPFHSTECEGGHGQFHDKNWPKPKREALMDSLVKIIGDYRLSGFASIVPIDEYRAVFPNSGRFDPYYLSVRHTLINMAVIADRIGDDMEVWFEDSRETSPTSLGIYNKIRSLTQWKPASRVSRGIRFVGKGICPLQAADLVAREALKHIQNDGIQPTRKAVQAMSERLAFIKWNRDTLTYLRDNGGPEDYELLTNWERGGNPPRMDVFYRNF
jgi:hypothetical protein